MIHPIAEKELFEICGTMDENKTQGLTGILNKAFELVVKCSLEIFVNTFENVLKEEIFLD